jgi:isoquinoline 1-oxidoreductase beta subunit
MVQGAVVDGIGNALYGGLTHKNGVVEQNNFHSYRIIRMHEAPKKVEVHFVQNDIDPTGLGEPPFPPVFGAVANACIKLPASVLSATLFITAAGNTCRLNH